MVTRVLNSHLSAKTFTTAARHSDKLLQHGSFISFNRKLADLSGKDQNTASKLPESKLSKPPFFNVKFIKTFDDVVYADLGCRVLCAALKASDITFEEPLQGGNSVAQVETPQAMQSENYSMLLNEMCETLESSGLLTIKAKNKLNDFASLHSRYEVMALNDALQWLHSNNGLLTQNTFDDLLQSKYPLCLAKTISFLKKTNTDSAENLKKAVEHPQIDKVNAFMVRMHVHGILDRKNIELLLNKKSFAYRIDIVLSNLQRGNYIIKSIARNVY